MPLSDLVFSDLILLPDGTATLKGCPGHGQQLVPVPAKFLPEVKDLPRLLLKAVEERRTVDPTIESRPEAATLRYEHNGVFYRVADLQDVDSGRTWFLRRIPSKVPALTSLGLPKFLVGWLLRAEQRQGLILVAGAQASGKTTTASALVAERLTLHGGHAVTYENPAEHILGGRYGEHGLCFQSEIHGEQELASKIERSHRFGSPNIIFIGEIRTKHAAVESLRIALGSKQQLVIATIHGFSLIAALERLVNWAREIDANASENLATALLAVIFQDLEAEPRFEKVPQSLLVPFTSEHMPTRAKIRENQLSALQEELRSQRNNMLHGLIKL